MKHLFMLLLAIDFVTIGHKQYVIVETDTKTIQVEITKEEMNDVDGIVRKVINEIK